MYLIPPSSCRDLLLASHTAAFYAQHDPAVAVTILNRYTTNQLVAYLLDYSNRNILINYLYSLNPNGLTAQALIDPSVGMCTGYLNTLNTFDPFLIQNLYNFFNSPPPAPTPTMIAWLSGMIPGPPPFPPTMPVLANQILAFNPGANLLAFQSLSTGQLMSILNAVYPGGIPITVSQLETMYSDYDLVHCIEQQDPTLQGWVIGGGSGIPTSQLLDEIKLYDGANFVNAGLDCDITRAESILCGAGYDMNTFVQTMATDPDPALHVAVNDFWIRWNGTPAGIDDRLSLNELVMYGSKRLGVVNVDTTLVVSKYDGHTSGEEMQVDFLYSNTTLQYDTIFFTRRLGKKWFELSNHLGNVVTVISDRKMAVDSSGDSTIDYYTADVRSAQEYYAYGSELEGRRVNSTAYKFDFNGKPTDAETGLQDYGMRIYDPRINRFISVDPLTQKYPFYAPYQFAGDKPIQYIDLDGLEENNPFEEAEPPEEPAEEESHRGLDNSWQARAMESLANSLGPKMEPVPYSTSTQNTFVFTKLPADNTARGPIVIVRPRLTNEPLNLKVLEAQARMTRNRINGNRREEEEKLDLQKLYPNAQIFAQRYLRNSEGKIVKDPLTGKARRLDFVVVQNGKVVASIETTSMKVEKGPQLAKEARIRNKGGTYIRIPKTKVLINMSNVKTQVSKRE